MFQTDQATAATSLPTPAAAGTPGYFTNGNPSTGVAATILDADFMNMVMMELANVVTGAGIALSKTTYNQVLSAIKRIGQNTAVIADTGVANAYAAANATPLVAGTWVDGVVQAVKIANTNTGASTYAPDGLTAIPIYGLGLQALQGGELFAGGTAILMHATIAGVNSGNPICVLMECAGGAQQVTAATASKHAPQAGQVQRNAFNYASSAGGTANALTATLTPAPASYTDDLTVVVRVASANTGATTLNVNGLGATAVVGAGHQPLQGGELAANGFACFAYSQALASFILLWTTGGAEPVGPATQSNHAVQLGQVGHGQCRLSVTSATTLTLKPYNGNNVIVNGAPLQLPSAGVSVTPTTAASTLYYVYLGGTTAAPVLSISTTGHSTASNGVETQAGNTAISLVGMVYTNASGQFVDSLTSRTCLNWFNRRQVVGNAQGTSLTFTNTTISEVSTAVRVQFLAWADEGVYAGVDGYLTANNAPYGVSAQSFMDGAAWGSLITDSVGTANYNFGYASANTNIISEGLHTAQVYANLSGSGPTGTLVTLNNKVITRG